MHVYHTHILSITKTPRHPIECSKISPTRNMTSSCSEHWTKNGPLQIQPYMIHFTISPYSSIIISTKSRLLLRLPHMWIIPVRRSGIISSRNALNNTNVVTPLKNARVNPLIEPHVLVTTYDRILWRALLSIPIGQTLSVRADKFPDVSPIIYWIHIEYPGVVYHKMF